MSGGLDSTAAALLLSEQGYQLVGCTFRTRYTSEQSLTSARELAAKLGIEHHVVDFTEVFDDTIIRYFREEYLEGRTPNPCVLCNRVIKFGVLMDVADQYGCDKIATGHYARVEDGYICRAKDTQKDQTYFLWQLSPEQLSRVVFPLGDMTKLDVRAYLREKGYTTLAEGGESQDICFIYDDYRSFLQLPPNPGDYSISPSLLAFLPSRLSPKAKHEGYTNYTIGQRKGLGIALGTPVFVTKIDAEKNIVTLGTQDELYTHEVQLRDVTFRGNPNEPVMAQIRYRSKPQEARIMAISNQQSAIRFNEVVWAVTPGQSCVFYQGNRLVGGGIIA